jgi:hypothetical protein
MPDDAAAELAALPALSSVQLAFLASLVPGPRPTWRCQDAITVGNLVRLNLVAWSEIRDPSRRRDDKSTFSLTPLAMQVLTSHGHPGPRDGAGERA